MRKVIPLALAGFALALCLYSCAGAPAREPSRPEQPPASVEVPEIPRSEPAPPLPAPESVPAVPPSVAPVETGEDEIIPAVKIAEPLPGAAEPEKPPTEAEIQIQEEQTVEEPPIAADPEVSLPAAPEPLVPEMTAPEEPSAAEEPEAPQATEEPQEPEPAEEPSAAEEPEAPRELEPAPPVPSRRVTLYVNQYLDIPYPGTGWVYLGDTENRNLVSYIERKQAGVNTVFTVRADKPGRTLLQFYRNDRLAGADINDYFELTILDAPAAPAPYAESPPYTNIRKPAEPPAAPETPKAPPPTPAALQPASAPEESAPLVVDIPAEQPEAAEQPAPPVEAAAAESQAKEPLTANGLYQQAQSYEARSPSRDIRQALALYQQLVDTFPASPLAQDAQKRIIYLKRFYFEIP